MPLPPSQFLHKKIPSWKSLEAWALHFDVSLDNIRSAVMENTEMGYTNFCGEYAGPAFDVKTGSLLEVINARASIEPPLVIHVVGNVYKIDGLNNPVRLSLRMEFLK